MNRKHKFKLIGILCLVVILGLAAGLILYALKQNINLFYTPTQLLQAHINPTQSLRIGGYVKKNSVNFDNSGTRVNFIVTDRTNEIAVDYQGILPNLFREGQAVVVTGKLVKPDQFAANEVLAKHDEKYMPRVLEKELQKNGSKS